MTQFLKICRAMLVLFFVVSMTGGCDDTDKSQTDEHGHGAGHEETVVKGPNGGRWLVDDDAAVELAIAETTTPPMYRAWLYHDGELLSPDQGSVDVTVTRLGNVVERHTLKPTEDGSLRASTIVGEPHSFDVEVRASVQGKSMRFTYPSYEGRTRIDPDIAAQTGIRTAPVSSGTIADEHEVQGLLTPIEGRVARVTARFPGVIRSVEARLGDSVRRGQSLAHIDSNLSLSGYAINAPIAGTVMTVQAVPGELAAEGKHLFEIVDLSALWVDLHLFGADADHIQPGAAVKVVRLSDAATIGTSIDRILPGTATASQSTVARATVPNKDMKWRPGSAVRARITVATRTAEFTVPIAALQKFRDWDVVFIRVDDTYEIRPLELGERDANQVEVISGLKAGDDVVVEQSYLVKADIEKSGASHDH